MSDSVRARRVDYRRRFQRSTAIFPPCIIPIQGTFYACLLSFSSHDLPTGDFFTGVPGWLGGEIVGGSVKDHRPPHDVTDGKPIGDEGTESVAVGAKDRRHISGVIGMGTAQGIVVHAHIGEGILFVAGAGAALVDVKGENGALATVPGSGQPRHFGDHQHAVSAFIKADRSTQVRIGFAAPQISPRRGIAHAAADRKDCIWIHKTPRLLSILFQYMPRWRIGAGFADVCCFVGKSVI